MLTSHRDDMQTRQLSDQAALQEAKTALLSLRLELSQAHQKELNEVRIEKDKKIEALQNELLKAFDKKLRTQYLQLTLEYSCL